MRRGLVIVVTLTTLVVGGCGIPDDSDVTVVGPGPTANVGGRDNTIPSVRNIRSSAGNPQQLVRYYLQAAAGDPQDAMTRVKAFMSDGFKAKFQAQPDVKVIRVKGDPLVTPGDPEVTFNAQQIGTLRGNGSLEPSLDAPREYTLKVGQIAGQSGYFVLDAPKVLLLSDTALDNYYDPQTIYFWNNENTALVPDLRYMPRDIPSAQRPTTILKWLVTGPAAWLNDVVHGLPAGTSAPDNVPASTNGTLTVTLTSQAVPTGDTQALNRLRRQLQWSLRDGSDAFTLQLKIGHQDGGTFPDSDYLSSNPAYRLVKDPERFVVYNGAVRRLTKSSQPDAPIPVLKPEENKNIAAAAMSTSSTHTFAAVVVGSGKNGKLRVAAVTNGQQGALKEVRGLSGTLGRPVWAVTADNDPAGAAGLITVNGKLFTFRPDGSPAVPVAWPGAPGPITAVSIAPDGYRVALVAAGQLYRTTLDTGGDAPSLSKIEQILAPGFSTVASVAWSSETYLAVAGVRDDSPRYAVVDVTVDGAIRYTRLEDIGKGAITYLTAYPSNPVTGGDNAVTESYEVAGSAWDVLNAPERIGVSDLAGPTASPPPGQTPTAPFFLD